MFYDMAEILTINQQTMNSQQMELYLLTGKKNQLDCRSYKIIVFMTDHIIIL